MTYKHKEIEIWNMAIETAINKVKLIYSVEAGNDGKPDSLKIEIDKKGLESLKI